MVAARDGGRVGAQAYRQARSGHGPAAIRAALDRRAVRGTRGARGDRLAGAAAGARGRARPLPAHRPDCGILPHRPAREGPPRRGALLRLSRLRQSGRGALSPTCVPAGRRGCGRAARMPAPARRAGTRDAPAGGSALQRGAARLPGARPAAAARAGDASHRRRGEGEGRRDRRRRRDRILLAGGGWLLRARLAARL